MNPVGMDLEDRSVVVDCRFLRHTGVGRVTLTILAGLAELRPPGRWILWGPPDVEEFQWEGAVVVHSDRPPLAGLAQRDLLAVPQADVALFLHAVRPLVVHRTSVVLLHDVIPAFHEASRVQRLLWKAFFRLSARTASAVMVYSDATAGRAEADLGVRTDRVHRVRLAVDADLVGRVADQRVAARAPRARLLYVGQVKPHKNLERALLAFRASRFAQRGGEFVAVGAAPEGVAELDRLVRDHAIVGVQIVGRCPEDELVDLYAGASAVIQPSIEEGFGLPVVEAMSAGIPVCCSDVPALREAAAGCAELFDPWSVASIAAAIDRATDPGLSDLWERRLASFQADNSLVTARELAEDVVAVVANVAARRHGDSRGLYR